MSGVMKPLAVFSVPFTGRNGVGAISVPGLKVGDLPFMISSGPGNPNADDSPWGQGVFELIITVDDQLQQIFSGDFSALSYTLFVGRVC